jgi:diguanylate cyclase (GGDEF)-like protein/PAS domain S-box-containing protein
MIHVCFGGPNTFSQLLPSRRARWLGRLWQCDRVATQPTIEDLLLYRVVTENVSDVIVQLDREHRRTYVSPSCQEVLGYSQSEMLGGGAFALVHPDDLPDVLTLFAKFGPTCPVQEATWRIRRKDGHYIWVEARYRYLEGDGGLVVILRDVHRRKVAEEQLADALRRLECLAMQDPLTGLPNRRRFIEAIVQKLTNRDELGLMFIDLNGFKPINDLHGHETGDAVLVGVATRLTSMLGDSGVVGRLGGDEFAILLDAHGGDAAVAASACRIMAAISEPFVIYGRTLNVAASIGIALSPRDGTETSALLRCADTAMYRAKQVPGGHFEFFAPSMALACEKATTYAAAGCVL